MADNIPSKELVQRMRDCWKRIDPLQTDSDPVGMTMASALLAKGAAEVERLSDDLRKAEAQKERCAGLTAGQWRAFFIQTQKQWNDAEDHVKRLEARISAMLQGGDCK